MNTELSSVGRRHVRIARLSWQLPVAGFVIMLILSAIEVELGLLGAPIFMLCAGLGFVFSIGTLWLAKKTPASRRHSVAGVVLFLVIAILMVLLCTIWNPYRSL